MFRIGYGAALKRRVVVNLTDGTAVEGVLWKRSGYLLVLRDAAYLEPGHAARPMDGEVLIEIDRVLFVQRP